DPAAHEGIKTAAVKNISLQMQLLEERLKVQTHPLENRKTVIDAYLFVFLRWVKMGLKTLSDYPSLNAFYERMMKDSGVQKALEEEKIL
ncbi:MAG: glutathione S-transferase family protein, partial [Deltaproteobacteria bacterium]|nr:glutathione S-transferase family protein [Deltaproteobacteria bacterium]